MLVASPRRPTMNFRRQTTELKGGSRAPPTGRRGAEPSDPLGENSGEAFFPPPRRGFSNKMPVRGDLCCKRFNWFSIKLARGGPPPTPPIARSRRGEQPHPVYSKCTASTFAKKCDRLPQAQTPENAGLRCDVHFHIKPFLKRGCIKSGP